MIKRIICTLIFAISLLLSCVKEQIFAPAPVHKGDGVTLYFSVKERPEQHTRSTSTPETLIDGGSVYVLVMSGNESTSTLIDFGVAIETQVGATKAYWVDLDTYTGACHAYIVANAKDVLDAAEVGWTKNVTTLGEISASLMTAELTKNGDVITAMPNTHPMIGDCALSAVGKNVSIGSLSSPIQLLPATVKVTVENRVAVGSDYTFQMLGANLGSAPEKSFIFAGQLGNIPTKNYGKNGDLSAMMVGVVTDNGVQVTEPLFGYESKAANNTYVILKASYNGLEGFYKLGFYMDADKQNSRELQRGFHYKINIGKVLSAGYRTASEAISYPTSNAIIYDINVEDTDSYDIITNGVQYLGVSNSEYIAYHSNYVNQYEIYFNDGVKSPAVKGTPLTPFNIVTLTYTTDPTWSNGEVTASAGIHLLDESLNRVTSIVLGQPVTPGATVRKELKVFMDDDFKSGQINIRIGNLQKIIKVKRELSFTILGDAISLGRDITFATARTLVNPIHDVGHTLDSFCDPNTYSFAYGKDGAALHTGDGSIAIDPNQELFLQIKNRFDWIKCDYCYGEIFYHKSTVQGRTKLSFAVEARGDETYGDYSYSLSTKVSSAFWKSSEKGERLLQILQTNLSDPQPESLLSGRWQARVLFGQDFIRLAEWDESLQAVNNHFVGDPESRPVENGKLELYGDDFLLRFRIGLTSTNEGKKNRYGLIQIIYLDKRADRNIYGWLKPSSFIFVRQGEEADNILTPGETYNLTPQNWYAPSPGTFIAPDVKFSPYALIDPLLGAGGINISDHNLITEANKPIFAPYPTYTDYLFQWSGNRFINAFNPTGAIEGWDVDNYPTEFKERCPDGYITPPTKIGGEPTSNGMRCDFRGFAYGNAYEGYCMDGYMDRYIHTVFNNTYGYDLQCFAPYTLTDIGNFTTVNNPGTGSFVLFNPKTMASLFLPKAYFRGNYVDDKILIGALYLDRSVPYNAILWASDVDPTNPDNAYSFSFGSTILGINGQGIFIHDKTGVLNKSAAARIRCIKDTNKP